MLLHNMKLTTALSLIDKESLTADYLGIRSYELFHR